MDDHAGPGAAPRRGVIESLSGAVDDASWGRLERYAQLLGQQSRRLRLVSRRAEGEIGLHVTDAAALLRVEPLGGATGRAQDVADLGTGGGIPGVVIAILRPAVRVVLVDARRSRIVFLKEAARELALDNVEVVHARLEALGGVRQFDVAVSRALGAIEETLVPSLRLLSSRGRLILFKGPAWEREEARAVSLASGVGCELGWVRDVQLPGYGRGTRFVEFHVKQEGRAPGTPGGRRSQKTEPPG